MPQQIKSPTNAPRIFSLRTLSQIAFRIQLETAHNYTTPPSVNDAEPRSGGRMQPTAQAVVGEGDRESAPEGRKTGMTASRQGRYRFTCLHWNLLTKDEILIRFVL